MPRRDPDATRGRILAAAGELFAAAGFAGTRIDAVAARSGANKRMIYHYFGGKEALFKAVLSHRLADSPWRGDREIDAADARLIAWEGLEWDGPVAASDRTEAIDGFKRILDARLAEGRTHPKVDSALLALVLMSARLFPRIAPRYAALVDGNRPEFETRYREFLAVLSDALSPAPSAAKPRVTLRPKVTGGSNA